MNILRGESNLVQWVQTSHLGEMMQPCNCFTHANKILQCWRNNACTIWRLLHMLCWNTMIKQFKYNTELAMSPRGKFTQQFIHLLCSSIYISFFNYIYSTLSTYIYIVIDIFINTKYKTLVMSWMKKLTKLTVSLKYGKYKTVASCLWSRLITY